MKKILYFTGAALYGTLISYIIWLLIYFLSPWLMSFGWMAIILYWLLAFGLIGGLIGGISNIIFLPLQGMINKCYSAKFTPIISMFIFGYSAITQPWNLDIQYSLVKIFIASSISITAFIIFISWIYLLFKTDNK